MGSFYNTTHQNGLDLFTSNEKAKSQEELIYGLFKAKAYMGGVPEMTPFGLLERLEDLGYRYPITSIRRALTNLTKEGRLEKTDKKEVGAYGQLNYVWRLK